MTTDTSEKGLETLIMRHMTGTDGLAVVAEHGRRAAAALRRHRLHRRQRAGLRPRPRARRAAALRLPARHPARGVQEAGAGRRERRQGHQPPQVPRPPLGRDRQARRHRRAAQGRGARAGALRPVLRHAVAGQRQGRGAARRRTASRHAPARLQHGRDAPRARPVPVHQRPAHRHLRAEEQPHQADGRGRRRAVQARPRPARAAVRVRPLRGALRGGRQRGADVHRAAAARARGSCPSTRATTTARATRPTRTASRPTTSGKRCSPRRG